MRHIPAPHPTRPLRALSLAAALAAGLLAGAPAPAHAGPFSPVVIVNDQAVTQFEIDQRLRFMTLLRAPEANRAAVERELILDRLKMDVARRMGITVSDSALTAGMAEFAARANMGTDEFVAALAQGGVERQTYRDFVLTGTAWREVVRQRVVPRVTVSDAEIDQAMKRMLDTPLVTDVLVSEIVMPTPQGSEAAVMERAQRLAATIGSEGAFASAARQYSASPSAEAGGRLQWLRVADLPEGLGPILLALQPGQITQPLQIPGAVVLFYMRDHRGSLRPGARDEQVDYLTLTVDSAATAASILATATSCDTLYQAAGSAAGSVQRQTVPTGSVPQGIGIRLASLDPNEGTVIDMGGAAQLVMLCKRERVLLAAPDPTFPVMPDAPELAGDAMASDLPSRAAMREQLFNQKINTAADALLAELRANAIIRRP